MNGREIRGKISISKDEAKHIGICMIAISFAFAIMIGRLNGLLSSPREFLVLFVASFMTVGTGFILHEMAHKLVAIWYGAPARFLMWPKGLLLMLASSFLGVLFAAPGAVYIFSDKISKRQNGTISIAGQMVNLVLVGVFLALGKIIPVVFNLSIIEGMTLNVWNFGAKMNIILGLFNMIPAFPLDGSKVLSWNFWLWSGITLIMLGVSTLLLGPGYAIVWLIFAAILMVLSRFAFG